jgi:hypothetical protein
VLGRLDWPPSASTAIWPGVRLYDPFDRPRAMSGEPIGTARMEDVP